MARTAVLVLLIGLVLAFLCGAVQRPVRDWLKRWPRLIWLAPIILTALFSTAAWMAHAGSVALTAAMLAYTAVPTLCAWFVLDFAAILFLWLPLEFSAGAALVPKAAQGFLHSVAYGVAILLGLVLFRCFRGLEGMKYNAPRRPSDWWLPVAAFAITAPILILVGIPIGFIPPPHLPTVPGGKMAAALGIVFAGTALPEEILFRSLIQNCIMQRWGENTRTLLAASLIFGAAHLDNGPQPLPNWRYMILATIAGFAYGKVFQKSSSVVSSALLHTMVDWTKHYFF